MTCLALATYFLDSPVDVSAMDIESAKHYPSPEHYFPVNIANQAPFVFSIPIKAGIELVSVLVAGFLVDVSPL